MSRRWTPMTDALYEYLLEVSSRECEAQRDLRAVTAGLRGAGMQISPEQGQFMALLARLVGARRCLEIGVYTGYSALSVALALPDDARIVACDLSEEWTSIARQHWDRAGVGHRIELVLAPASETLQRLLREGEAGRFDFAFIDADKESYGDYYEWTLQLLRPGGLICVDNTLWSGAVADPARNDVDTRALREFNRRVHHDERVDLSLVPIGDGLTLLRKR